MPLWCRFYGLCLCVYVCACVFCAFVSLVRCLCRREIDTVLYSYMHTHTQECSLVRSSVGC